MGICSKQSCKKTPQRVSRDNVFLFFWGVFCVKAISFDFILMQFQVIGGEEMIDMHCDVS